MDLWKIEKREEKTCMTSTKFYDYKQICKITMHIVCLFGSFYSYYFSAAPVLFTYLSQNSDFVKGGTGISTVQVATWHNDSLKIIEFSCFCLLVTTFVLIDKNIQKRCISPGKELSNAVYPHYFTTNFGFSLALVSVYKNYFDFKNVGFLIAGTTSRIKVRTLSTKTKVFDSLNENMLVKVNSEILLSPDITFSVDESKSGELNPVMKLIDTLRYLNAYKQNCKELCVLSLMVFSGYMVMYTLHFVYKKVIQRKKLSYEVRNEKEQVKSPDGVIVWD